MRRSIGTLRWEAEQWEGRSVINTFDGERLEGSSAYAYEQADICLGLATRFEALWSTPAAATAQNFRPEIDAFLDIDDQNIPTSDAMDVDVAAELDTNDQEVYEEEVEEGIEDEDMDLMDEDEDEEAQEDEIEEDETEGRLEDEEDQEMEIDGDGVEGEESLNIREMLVALEEEQV
jgi:hypothetical protein